MHNAFWVYVKSAPKSPVLHATSDMARSPRRNARLGHQVTDGFLDGLPPWYWAPLPEARAVGFRTSCAHSPTIGGSKHV